MVIINGKKRKIKMILRGRSLTCEHKELRIAKCPYLAFNLRICMECGALIEIQNHSRSDIHASL